MGPLDEIDHIDELLTSIEVEAVAAETARQCRVWREKQTWADDPDWDFDA